MARGKLLILTGAATLMLTALTIGNASAAAPTATASRACSVSSHGGAYGKNMYVLDLKVRNTTCRKGKRVISAYTDCRHQHGGLNGRCPTRVLHYRCHEGERTVAPHIQYTADVGCRRGERSIHFTYTQQI